MAKAKKTKPDVIADAQIVPPLKLSKKVTEEREAIPHDLADAYAIIAGMETVLKTAKATLAAKFEKISRDYIAEKGSETKQRPAAFMFTGDYSQTTAVLSVRSAAKDPFNEAELKLIKALRLPLKEVELVPERYFLNEDVVKRLLEDNELRGKFTEAIRGLLGDDSEPIKVQPVQKVKAADDATVAALFKMRAGKVTIPATEEGQESITKELTAAEKINVAFPVLMSLQFRPNVVSDKPISFGEAFEILKKEGILDEEPPPTPVAVAEHAGPAVDAATTKPKRVRKAATA